MRPGRGGWALVMPILALVGCGHGDGVTRPRAAVAEDRGWSLEGIETMTWDPLEAAFAPGRAIEASGLAVLGDSLLVAVEKHDALLLVDPEQVRPARTYHLGLPPGVEVEGVSVMGTTAYLCDEAHGAVWRLQVPGAGEGGGEPGRPLPVERLRFSGTELPAGKEGLEGIAAVSDTGSLYLAVERERTSTGCVARIHRYHLQGDLLAATGDPVEVELEDCRWRLTSLEPWGPDRLLALKTRYPGERYHLVEVRLASGEVRLLLDLTETMLSLARDGYGNNLEGLAVGPEGDLFLVSDNAVTRRRVGVEPPPGRERTMLVRLPVAPAP